MKKTFHLDLDHSGVRLRYGSGNDMPVIGEVALDDPHFETRLDDMRRDAEVLAGGTLKTQLSIPHSEILFTTVDIPEDIEDETEQRKLVEAELDGQTPYAMDDLVIDLTPKSKGQIAVALVARETLDQAEDFAVAHGFNPQGFVAAPRKGVFRKRPSFGKTAFSSAGGDAVAAASTEPAVTRIADVLMNEPASPVEVTPEQSAPDHTAALTTPAAHDIVPGPTSEDAPESREDAATPADDKAAVGIQTKDAKSKDEAPKTPAEIAAAVDMGSAEDLAKSERQAPAAKTGIDADKGTDPKPKSAAQKKSKETSSPGDDAPTPAFSTRRTGDPAPSASSDPSPLGSIASRIAMMPDGGAGPRPGRHAPMPAMKVTNGGGAARKPASAPPGRNPSPVPSIRKVAPPETGPTPLPANVSRPATAVNTEAEQMTVFGARRDVQTRRGLTILPILIGLLVAFALAVGIWSAFFLLSPVDDALIAPRSEPQSAAAEDPVLPTDTDTALAPSQISPPADQEAPAFVDQSETPIPDIVQQDGASELALIAPSDDVATQAETASADDPDGAEPDMTAAQAEDAALTTDEATAVDQTLVPAPDDPLRRPEGAADDGRYAATGVEIAPPTIADAPPAERLESVFTPQPDGRLRTQDRAAALAPVGSPASVPSALLPPPPPGERFELNADGLVVATADGTRSPQGVLVTAGVPPRRPPPAPERPATTPEPPSEADLVIPVNQGEPALRPRSRPGLEPQQDARLEPSSASASVLERVATLSPRPRPATADTTDTAETAAAITTDQPASSPDEVEVARLTPRARPADIAASPGPEAPKIDAAQIGAAAASAAAAALQNLVPAAQAASASAIAPVQISPYAVARSQLPKTRPRNFSRTVARATQAQAQPVRVAAASAIASPSGPTRGSVASRATVANAINLGKVNLMGVYGTSANRRALVRLPSGRFVKVKVGDRVDGGRVRAIGADQLVYVKGGRQINLQMPRG